MDENNRGNRRKLECIQCNRILPMDKFPMASVASRYNQICFDCDNENRESIELEKLMEEQNYDPAYCSYICKLYGFNGK